MMLGMKMALILAEKNMSRWAGHVLDNYFERKLVV
jgi:hypothetical protein